MDLDIEVGSCVRVWIGLEVKSFCLRSGDPDGERAIVLHIASDDDVVVGANGSLIRMDA